MADEIQIEPEPENPNRFMATNLIRRRATSTWSIDDDPVNANWLALGNYMVSTLGMTPEEIGALTLDELREMHDEMQQYFVDNPRPTVPLEAANIGLPEGIEDFIDVDAILATLEQVFLDEGS